MVRFKKECPPHRIDCPLGRKPGGSTRAEEKPMRDTARYSVISFLSKLGITGRSLKVAPNRLQTTAQYASS